MTARRTALLIVAVLCGVLVAGCGSSSSPTTSSSTTATSSTDTSATTATSTSVPTSTGSTATPSTPSIPTGAPDAAAVAQYAAICKSIIQRAPTLSASVKAKVEGICAKAAHGDLAGARTAAKEVCSEVISASPIPPAAKEKALAACKAT